MRRPGFCLPKITAVSLETDTEGLSEITVILTTTINGLMHQFVFMRDWIFFLSLLLY